MDIKIIYNSIAISYLERLLNEKQFYSIPNRDNVCKIIDKIKNDSNNYFHIHNDIKKPNDKIINIYKQNESILFEDFIHEFEKYILFDVELQKYGQTFFSSRKRWALINYPNGIYSLTEPIFQNSSPSPNFELIEKKAKNKTEWLKKSKIIFEDKSRDSKHWKIADKNFRIMIGLSNSNKQRLSPIYLYFDNPDQREKVSKMLKLIKCKLLFHDRTSYAFKMMLNLVEGSYFYYSALKIQRVKHNLIRTKAILTSKLNYVNSMFTQFNYFGEMIFIDSQETYLKRINIPSIGFSTNTQVSKSSLIPLSSKNRLFLSKSMKKFKISVEKIIDKFPLFFKRKDYYAKQTTSTIGILKLEKFHLINESNSITSKNLTKDCKDIIHFCYFNKKNENIVFSNLFCLERKDILNISNVFLNSSLYYKPDPNSLIINGPKEDPRIYLRYYLNKEFYNDKFTERFIETDFFNLEINKCLQNSDNHLVIQIFYTSFYFDQDNINEMRKIYCSNDITPKDFYYYITITMNNSFKLRSSFVEMNKYVDEIIYLEFNKQFTFNTSAISNNLKDNNIIVSLHLIPKNCFDIENLNKILSIEYLLSQQIAHCVVKMKEFDHVLISNRLKTNKANQIKLNALQTKSNSKISSILFGKEYNVGCDFYILEEIDYDYIQSMRLSNNIDKRTKEKFWNINCDDQKNIILRIPNKRELKKIGENYDDEKFITELIKDQKDKIDILKIIENKRYSFLPYVQKLNCNKEIEDEFGNIDYDHAIEMGYKSGNWITCIRKFNKYFPAKLLGISERYNIYYMNYITGEIKVLKLDPNNYIEFTKYLKPIQENLFSLYNLNYIETNLFENLNKYDWSIMLKFETKKLMETFVYLLKDIRRKANLSIKNQCFEDEIDTKILLNNSNLERDPMKNMKLFLNKIEFRQHFTLSDNAFLTIKFTKNVDCEIKIRLNNVLEMLQDKNYKSSLIDKREVTDLIESIKNIKNDTKIFLKDHPIDCLTFNRQKALKFEYDSTDSFINFEVVPKLDKSCIVEMSIVSRTETIVLTGEINYEKVVNHSNIIADVFYIPLKLTDSIKTYTNKFFNQDTVVAIIDINIYTLLIGDKNIFNNVFDQTLKDINSISDDYDNYISFGQYEPNVYKRLITKKIEDEFSKSVSKLDSLFFNDQEKKSKLLVLLEKYCIRGVNDLKIDSKSEMWRELVVDLKAYNYKIKKRFYINKKRNEFYRKFSISEFKQFLNNIRKDKGLEKTNILTINDIYVTFPSRMNLINYKKKSKDNNFNQFRSLIYIGIPDEGRYTVWEKILDIQLIVNKTIEKLKLGAKVDGGGYNQKYFEELSKKSFEKKKMVLYDYYQKHIRVNYYSQFSLIDHDLNFLKLKFIDYRDIFEKIKIIDSLKNIAKSYFIWSKLEIFTNNISTSDNKKFVYFFGLLQLIHRLDSVFRDDYKTFWLICGLSQHIEIFFQINPLYKNKFGFSKMYVLITMLILEVNLSDIYNKLIELDFSIEIFLHNSVSSLFSDYFQTDLFLRMMDIIIFESSLITDNNDKYDYLRFLSTLQLTLFKMNEKKILLAKTVKELDSVLSDLVIKSYNVEKFMQKIRNNIDDFFKSKSLIDCYLDIRSTNTSWDHKRDKFTKQLQKYFLKVEEDNKMFLEKIDRSQIFSCNLINTLKKNISDYNEKSSNTKSKYNVIFIVTGIYKILNMNNDSDTLLIHSEFNFEKNFRYIFDDSNSANLIEIECLNGVVKNPKFYQTEIKDHERYLNISLFDQSKSLLGYFVQEIVLLDYMKPHRFRLESKDESTGKLFIDIGIIKIFLDSEENQNSDFINLVFSKPNYLFDLELYRILNDVKMNDLEINMFFNLISLEIEKYKDKSINGDYPKVKYDINYEAKLNDIKKFSNEEFNRLIENLKFYNNDVLIAWLKNNISSFQEILFCLVIIDESCNTIYEKLKLIFDIANIKNYLFYQTYTISVEQLKQVVYSLYKRFMINFTKVDVDRMVDYQIFKENLFNLRYAILYNNNNENEVIDMIQDKCGNKKANYDISNSPNNNYYVEITKFFSLKINLIKNVFSLNNLSHNLVSIILKMNNNLDKTFNRLIIQYEYENIKITNIYEYDMSSIKITPKESFIKEKDTDSIYKKVLKDEMESIQLTNNNNLQLDFEKFKDVFNNLPSLSDLFRCSMSFSEINVNSLIKVLPMVKVIIPTSDESHNKVFIFSKELIYSNTNSVMNYHVKGKIINSSLSLQDVFEIIVCHLSRFPIETSREVEFFLNNPTLMNFEIFIGGKAVGEEINFNDPLYSLNLIRNDDINLSIDIVFKLEEKLDKFIDHNISNLPVFKRNGFAKFINFDKKYFEWRECKIKDTLLGDKTMKTVTFNCLKNIAEFEKDCNDVINLDYD